ncbi:putative 3TM holin [compost metagenome]
MASASAAVVVHLDIWTCMASLVCGAISVRIVTYRRDGAHYKLGASLCAWVLAAATGGYSLSVVLRVLAGQPVESVSPLLIVILLVQAVQVFRARGNVASVLRLDWDEPWSGVDRRRAHR